jgi:glycosyltransferase involved in cell wall biosynthesis
MWPEALVAFLVRLLERRVGALPPADALWFLFRLDERLYESEGRAAVRYGNGIHPKHRVTRYHDFFVNRVQPADVVLDIGCGNGALSADVAERSGATVVGIDLNPGNIATARQIHAHPRVTYTVGDATELERTLDFRPETLDLEPRLGCNNLGESGTSNPPSTTNKQQALTSSPDLQSPVPNETRFTVVVLSNVLEHIDDRVGFLKRLQVYFINVKAEHREPNTFPQSLVTRHSSPAPRFLIRVPLFERDWRVPVKQELDVEWRLDATHAIEYTHESFLEEITQAGLMIVHQETRWGEIWAELEPMTFEARRTTPPVTYLHPGFPGRLPAMAERSSGGGVKYQWLNHAMPDQGYAARVLYAVSSAHRHDMGLVRRAKQDGVALVWNQNGVYVPWTYAPDIMDAGNAHFRAMMARADYVLYQSEYCRRSAERFVGPYTGRWEVLPNAVDTAHFVLGSRVKARPLVLLISGSHENPYRLTVALQTVGEIRKSIPDVRLIIAGNVRFAEETAGTITSLGVEECVDIVGSYNQQLAPDIYGRADILLHTKYADPCPTVVLEAMACGLPVVYSASGGVPELVGPDAGIGIPAPLDWQNAYPPDPVKMAEAVLKIAQALSAYREAARQRAVDKFDIKPWIQRHREIFQMLIED